MNGRPKYVSFFVTDNKKKIRKLYAEIVLSLKDASCEKLTFVVNAQQFEKYTQNVANFLDKE